MIPIKLGKKVFITYELKAKHLIGLINENDCLFNDIAARLDIYLDKEKKEYSIEEYIARIYYLKSDDYLNELKKLESNSYRGCIVGRILQCFYKKKLDRFISEFKSKYGMTFDILILCKSDNNYFTKLNSKNLKFNCLNAQINFIFYKNTLLNEAVINTIVDYIGENLEGREIHGIT